MLATRNSLIPLLRSAPHGTFLFVCCRRSPAVLAADRNLAPQAYSSLPVLALRPGQRAAISTTPQSNSQAVETRPQVTTGPGLTASGKIRQEVPLPSQQEKKGVMQYALFVRYPALRKVALDFHQLYIL